MRLRRRRRDGATAWVPHALFTIDRVQVLQCIFELEHQFHTEIANLIPQGIAAAAKLSRGGRLTEHEEQWISGCRGSVLVVELDDRLGFRSRFHD